MSATLLPNAEQQFVDANGKPLCGGSVYFYIPNTSTFKNTWQDSAQTILNTNPIILDAGGRAIIWGSGTYRQVVYDQFGNLIWDQITEAVNSDLVGNLTDNLYVAGTGFTPGTTTQLTLSSGPGSTANMWVYFDGVWQMPDTYSVSGTTVTFTSPIPVGVQEVDIKVGNTISIGTPSSGSVTDASVASGTKLYNRINDIYDVKDFGAVGDGVADDTAAVQAAINAACPFTWQGSTRATELNGVAAAVYFPSGIYKVTSKIRLAPGLRLFGENAATDYMSRNGTNGIANGGPKHLGSCIFSTLNDQTSYAIDTSPYNASGVRVDNYLQTGGDSSAGTHTQVQGVVFENITIAGNWTSRGINLAGADTCRFRNVFIKGFNVGIRCSAVWYGQFQDVTIESNYRGFIAWASVTDVTMNNISIRNQVDGVTYNPATQGRDASDPPPTADLTQSMIDENTGILNYYGNIVGWNVDVENVTQAFLTSNGVDYYKGIYVEGISDTILRVANFDQQNGYYHFDTINLCTGNLLWCSQARVYVDCSWTNYTQANFNKLISFLNAPGNARQYIPIFNPLFQPNPSDTLSSQFYRYACLDTQQGTWTPSLSFGGNSAGTQTNYGWWTRVGNRVTIDFNINLSVKSGATGGAVVSGLPFNVNTDVNRFSAGSTAQLGSVTTTMVPVTSWNSGATFYFLRAPGATQATDVDFSNGAQITGTITYQVQQGT